MGANVLFSAETDAALPLLGYPEKVLLSVNSFIFLKIFYFLTGDHVLVC